MINTVYNAIVAGAGIWGCTIARRLAEAGKKVLVLEKRRAVGGNCRCRTIDGIEVHLYGSHIFHTSNEEVWKFVNRFVHFNGYKHVVLARTKKIGRENRSTEDGQDHIYHLPIGCTLLKEFFGRDLKPSELSDADRKALFDAFVRGYTSKQWGVPPEKVDPAIIARLKVRDNYSTDYFDDPHQGIPLEGYNALFERMLDHPNITVACNREVRLSNTNLDRAAFVAVVSNRSTTNRVGRNSRMPKASAVQISPLPDVPVYYSGPIDALFNYKFGALPWRSLRFETEHLPQRDFQHATVVNYTDFAVPYTRIHEFRHYHPEREKVEVEGRGGQRNDSPFSSPKGTIITREYPADWQKGDEPYYPIANPESAALLAKYQEEAAKLPGLVIGGRLGMYKYFDMDKSIEAALKVEIA